MKYATVTDYDALYGSGYFAHQPESSSFSKEHLPGLLHKFCDEFQLSGVLDIGSGNGILGSLLRSRGIPCLDVDVMHRESAEFVRCDFSKNDIEAISEIKHRCDLEFKSNMLVVSFDMAEHLDVEHIPDFVYNLSEVITKEAIISISTRPSSRANLFHSTVLPIDTWKYIFSLVELEAAPLKELQVTRSNQQFNSDTQGLLVVSAWQKRNVFLDDPSHQHYLKLTRRNHEIPSRQALRERIEAVLDVTARSRKRTLLADRSVPRLVYLVSFVQDWAFLRSFMDVWPAAQICVILRRDFIVAAYADVIEAYLLRVGVSFKSVWTTRQACQALDSWRTGPGELFLTATEGLPWVLHGMASLITLEARKRGMTTVTLQHGDLVPERTVHAAQFFIAMDETSRSDFQRSSPLPRTCTPLALGAPKHLDSTIVPADPDAIAFRLRSVAGHYRLRLLVGTNLHWTAHDLQNLGFSHWLNCAAEANPDVLFLLRPHPDEAQIFGADSPTARSNVVVLDEITLLCIDWPMSRVISAVDGVISSHSTLVLDGLASGKPVAIFPTGITDQRLLAVESGWKERGAVELSKDQCSRGALPEGWLKGHLATGRDSAAEYLDFMSGVLALVDQDDDPGAIAAATQEVERSFLESCLDLSLDAHPHGNRQAVSSAISRFVCETTLPQS